MHDRICYLPCDMSLTFHKKNHLEVF